MSAFSAVELLMKKTLIVLLLVLASLSGCKGDRGKNGVEAEAPKRTKIGLNYDMTEEKRLQEAADRGSQAWRKEAVDVAHAALINQGINAKIEECRLTEDHNAHSVVNAKCKDGEFNITLKKIVRPDGIWTATEIELVGEFKGLGAPGHGGAGHDHGGMHDNETGAPMQDASHSH